MFIAVLCELEVKRTHHDDNLIARWVDYMNSRLDPSRQLGLSLELTVPNLKKSPVFESSMTGWHGSVRILTVNYETQYSFSNAYCH